MKPSVRIRHCHNCEPPLFRHSSLTRLVFKSWTIRLSSHRLISWKTLFGVSRVPDQAKSPRDSSTTAKEESRLQHRARTIVQRLRETRDTRRPSIPQKPDLSHSENAHSAPPQIYPLSSPKQLNNVISKHVGRDKSIIKPPDLMSSYTDVKLDHLQRKALNQLNSSALSDLNHPKTGAFKAPLRIEQRDALVRYLKMASSEKESRESTAKFPWEEPPIPSETTGSSDLRDLLTMKLERHGSTKDGELQGTSDSHIVDAANFIERMGPSKLYQQLRNHHIRVQSAVNQRRMDLLSAANRNLDETVDSTIRETDSRFGHTQKFKKPFVDAFRNLLRTTGPTNSVRDIITPLIKYILVEQGFSPTREYIIIDSVPRAGETQPQNGFKFGVFETMILNCIIAS